MESNFKAVRRPESNCVPCNWNIAPSQDVLVIRFNPKTVGYRVKCGFLAPSQRPRSQRAPPRPRPKRTPVFLPGEEAPRAARYLNVTHDAVALRENQNPDRHRPDRFLVVGVLVAIGLYLNYVDWVKLAS